MITNVVIAIAMEAEASPFVNHMELKPAEGFFPTETPFQAFKGKHKSCDLTVITNGKDGVCGTGVDNVGTVPAALATFLSLQKLKGDDNPADISTIASTPGASVEKMVEATGCEHREGRAESAPAPRKSRKPSS